MKLYLIATAVVFALLAVSHIARMAAEGTYLLSEPIFVITTLLSLSFCVWSILLLRRLPKTPRNTP